MKFFFAVCILLITTSAHAGVSPNTEQEITHLFTHLKTSGCEFNRNGTWYNAEKAVAHLNRKYEYLLGKNLISTTEDFIVRAATESSMSHKAYLVKCGNNESKSAAWFKEELANYRSK